MSTSASSATTCKPRCASQGPLLRACVVSFVKCLRCKKSACRDALGSPSFMVRCALLVSLCAPRVTLLGSATLLRAEEGQTGPEASLGRSFFGQKLPRAEASSGRSAREEETNPVFAPALCVSAQAREGVWEVCGRGCGMGRSSAPAKEPKLQLTSLCAAEPVSYTHLTLPTTPYV